MNKWILRALLVLLTVAFMMPIYGCTERKPVTSVDTGYSQVPEVPELSNEPGTQEAADPAVDEPEDNAADLDIDLQPLEASLEKRVAALQGDWAIYIKDLQSGETIVINNHKMKSASLIKLFIMVAVYTQSENGSLTLNKKTLKLLNKMITVSDNEASNTLVTMLGDGDFKQGMNYENLLNRSLGYTDSEQQRDMKDWRDTPVEGENYTSVKDCGVLLERIYRGECISQDCDQQMLDLLFGQTRRGKIPAGLPANAKVANKTGELTDTENDAAIVYTLNGDYIIVVMSSDLKDVDAARLEIVDISSEVYDYIVAYKRG